MSTIGTFLKVAASAALATFIGVAAAAPAKLDLEEAQRLAIARSRQVAAYEPAVKAARDMANAAAHLDEPTLQLGVDYLPFPSPLTTREARDALADRYAREADRASVKQAAATLAVARNTALAWLDCYYVEQMSRVAADQLKAARDEVEGAERMYWAGRLGQAEFYAARSMLVMFEDKSSELEHHRTATRIALERWVGDAGRATLAELPDIDRIRLAPAGLEGDLAREPEVALMDAQAELAASDVRIAQASGRSAPEIAATTARRDEAVAARDEKLRDEVARVRIMIDQWVHARDRRDRYVRELVPLARERTLATLVSYRGGKGTISDVLAARRAETEARMQSIEMEQNVARIWSQIDFAVPGGFAVNAATSPTGVSAQ